MSVKITNNHKDEIEAALASAIPMALEKCGLVAEGYAKRLCPVDTGNLRNSLTHTTDENTAYIGTAVEYAPYVELGTSRTRAQPYLKPAIIDHIQEYEDILKNALNK